MSCAITYCPPSTSFEHFDAHQFATRPNRPVSAQYAGSGEWRSNSLSFGDYNGCHTVSRKLFPSRRFVTPEWATNDKKLQQIIVEYLLRRATGDSKRLRARMPKGMKTVEQLRWAEQVLRERVPGLERIISELCAELVELKQRGVRHPYLQTIEALIQNHDTSIRINRNAGAVVAGVVYSYYREGLNSVAVAESLGISSPGVRQLLFRIWQVAKKLGYAVEPFRLQKNSTTVFRDESTGEIIEGVRPKRAKDALASAAAIRKADDRWSAENLAAYRANKVAVEKPPARAVTPAIEASRAERAEFVERYRTQNVPKPPREKSEPTRARWRRLGLCSACGKAKEPEYKSCPACREKNRVRQLPRLAASKAERHARGLVPKEVWKANLSASQKAAWARKKAAAAITT